MVLVPQEISEPTPATHQVNADRRLGGADDLRDLARPVAGGVVEDHGGSLALGQGGEADRVAAGEDDPSSTIASQ